MSACFRNCSTAQHANSEYKRHSPGLFAAVHGVTKSQTRLSDQTTTWPLCRADQQICFGDVFNFHTAAGVTFLKYSWILLTEWGFPGGASGKEPANAGDIRDSDSIPGWGKPPRGGHGNPLQYSCLESPVKRGAWWATVHRVAKSRTLLKQLSTFG